MVEHVFNKHHCGFKFDYEFYYFNYNWSIHHWANNVMFYKFRPYRPVGIPLSFYYPEMLSELHYDYSPKYLED